jgi:hypothetical protein
MEISYSVTARTVDERMFADRGDTRAYDIRYRRMPSLRFAFADGAVAGDELVLLLERRVRWEHDRRSAVRALQLDPRLSAASTRPR